MNFGVFAIMSNEKLLSVVFCDVDSRQIGSECVEHTTTRKQLKPLNLFSHFTENSSIFNAVVWLCSFGVAVVCFGYSTIDFYHNFAIHMNYAISSKMPKMSVQK
jgi:hypothetical protein